MAVEAPRSQGRGGLWAEGVACYVEVQSPSLTPAAADASAVSGPGRILKHPLRRSTAQLKDPACPSAPFFTAEDAEDAEKSPQSPIETLEPTAAPSAWSAPSAVNIPTKFMGYA